MLIKEINHEGFIAKILLDETPLDPREDYPNLGKLWVNPGDRYTSVNELDFDYVTFPDGEELSLDDCVKHTPHDFEVWLANNGYLFLRVYHKCDVYSTEQPKEERGFGHVGYIIVSKETVYTEYRKKRISSKLAQMVYSALASEVEQYSLWANGEVYGYSILYTIEDQEEIYEVFGIAGLDYVEQSAKSEIDFLRKIGAKPKEVALNDAA